MLHIQESIQILAIVVAIIFFVNKVLVLLEQKSGWLVGMVGAILATAYLYLIGLYIFSVLEMGLIVLMGYGFFAKDHKNKLIEQCIRGVTVAATLISAYFVFAGMTTVYEIIGSIGMLVGTYLLTHENKKLGWFLYAIAHGITAYLCYGKSVSLHNDSHTTAAIIFFADLQIASALIACVGLCIKDKK